MLSRRSLVATLCLSLLTGLLAACSGGGTPSSTTPPPDHLYRSPAGWMVEIPKGWHVLPFTSSRTGQASSGAEISNVKLPPPLDAPPTPIQPDSRVLPRDGIGLVIATDHPLAHSAPIANLPLTYPNGSSWAMGSGPAGSDTMDTTQFRGGTQIFTVAVEIGAVSRTADQRALSRIVQSLRFQG
jgi:hypothetical protein